MNEKKKEGGWFAMFFVMVLFGPMIFWFCKGVVFVGNLAGEDNWYYVTSGTSMVVIGTIAFVMERRRPGWINNEFGTTPPRENPTSTTEG